VGQQDVLDVLQKHKKPLSCSEISELLDSETPTDRIKINHACKIMLEHKEIKVIEIDRFQAKIRFGKNAPYRRLRLYYV